MLRNLDEVFRLYEGKLRLREGIFHLGDGMLRHLDEALRLYEGRLRLKERILRLGDEA